jgi:aminopeptidase N
MTSSLRLPLRLCVFARVILFLSLLVSTALAARTERLITNWRPTHYLINISLNAQLSEITTASARIDVSIIQPTRTIDLDFGDLTVDGVTLNSASIPFTHKDGKLLVELSQAPNPGDALVLTVNYHGKPKDGLIFAVDKDGHASVVGDNWPNRVHQWIPTFDHPSAKATVTFNVTAPANQEVVANGRLDHVETIANGQRTWTYTEGVPIPPYCMIIGVGRFARLEPPQHALTPLSYYVSLSERELAVKGFTPAIPSIEFFTRTIAPYPYEKLALIIGATRYGGMENSSAIVFTTSLFNRAARMGLSKTYGIPLNNVDVITHEIAHQWFGDSVTESTWSDLWLSEGFATYFAGLFLQRFEGEAAFRKYMEDAATAVFAYEKKSRMPIVDRDTEDLLELLNANSYQKGAWVLHMLRSNLGDDAFFRGIRGYYESHKNATASTDDLRVALEKSSGRDLRPFFTRWLFDSGHPQYALAWYWLGQRELRIVLTQKQSGKVFVDPVPIRIVTASGKRDVILKPASKLWLERISLREKPVRVEVDPDNRLLDEATVKGSLSGLTH